MIKLGDRVKIKKLWEGDTKPYYKDMGIELKEGMKGTIVYIGGDKYPYKIEFDGIDIPLWISSKSELEKIENNIALENEIKNIKRSVLIMKSKLIKEFKEMGIRRLGGKKLELYNFYELVGMYTLVKKGVEIK